MQEQENLASQESSAGRKRAREGTPLFRRLNGSHPLRLQWPHLLWPMTCLFLDVTDSKYLFYSLRLHWTCTYSPSIQSSVENRPGEC